jgi:branched-subunit amino acid transport protein
MNLWWIMLLAGLLTYGTRLSFVLLLDRLRIPDWFLRGLRFVPAAVLSAIILPELALRNSVLDLTLRNPQLFAGALAVLVAWKTKNTLLTILAGMGALLIYQVVSGMV